MPPQLLMMLMAQQAAHNAGQAGAGFAGTFANQPGRAYGNAERAYDFNVDRATKQFDPYSKAGEAAINPFTQRLNEMSDPGKFVNNAMSQYAESPQAKYLQKQSVRAGTNAASASGLTGSTPFAQQIQQNANDISSGDMEKYLGHYFDTNKDYMTGENNLINYGYNANAGKANLYGQEAPFYAEQEYNKEAAKQNNTTNRFSNLISMFTG